MSEVVDISPDDLDSSLWFIQPNILHNVLCILSHLFFYLKVIFPYLNFFFLSEFLLFIFYFSHNLVLHIMHYAYM